MTVDRDELVEVVMMTPYYTTNDGLDNARQIVDALLPHIADCEAAARAEGVREGREQAAQVIDQLARMPVYSAGLVHDALMHAAGRIRRGRKYLDE